jgi:hypothetical protein
MKSTISESITAHVKRQNLWVPQMYDDFATLLSSFSLLMMITLWMALEVLQTKMNA